MKNTGIIRLTNRYWNGTTATGDTAPGQSVVGYTGQPPQYVGQLGADVIENFAGAQARSDPAFASSLQYGRYQYVQFAADGTNYLFGQLLYWKDETTYVVTNVAPTSVAANFAGFCIAPVTQGNYWLMQTSGVAWALYKTSPTDLTAGDGVYAVVNTATVDALADGTADATSGVNKLFLGIAKDAPVSAVVKRIYITRIAQVE